MDVERKAVLRPFVPERQRHDVGCVPVAEAETQRIAALDESRYLRRLVYLTVFSSHQNRYTLISYGLVVKPLDIM